MKYELWIILNFKNVIEIGRDMFDYYLSFTLPKVSLTGRKFINNLAI